MQAQRAARIDRSSIQQNHAVRRPVELPVLVVGSVDPNTPTLPGADWIRLDGAQGNLDQLLRLRERHGLPTCFDIPGPSTRRNHSLLTHSEYLLFAASQEFEWVNLRGVLSASEIEHARRFLGPEVRLTATIQTPRVLRRSLDEICGAADALLVSCEHLERAVGPRHLRDVLRIALLGAVARQRPAFLVSGLLPSSIGSVLPDPSEVDQLVQLVSDGYRGLILTRETTDAVDPRGNVALARLIAQRGAPIGQRAKPERCAARIEGSLHRIPSAFLDETLA